jgi:hypothetical protein
MSRRDHSLSQVRNSFLSSKYTMLLLGLCTWNLGRVLVRDQILTAFSETSVPFPS